MADTPSDPDDRTNEIEAGTGDLEGLVLPHDFSTWKVLGETGVPDGVGVMGHNTATSGRARGVLGVTDSESNSGAAGVRGDATGSAGLNYGVFGKTSSSNSDAAGVRANAPNGDAVGVVSQGRIGVLSTGRGDGVFGQSQATTTSNAGVRGAAEGATGMIASGRLGIDVTGRSREADALTPQDHAAIIRDGETATSGAKTSVLALKTSELSTTGDDNYITFFNGFDAATGSIEGDGSGGVNYTSGTADYAEFLPRLDPDEEIEEAMVVGVIGGSVTKRTAEADQALVVSNQPIVTGNSPGQGQDARSDHETVAFVGQVPVKVRGAVAKGDLIVPSGEDDGTGRAIPAGTWTPGDGPVVGRAWEATDEESDDRVTVAVGLETGEALEPAIERNGERIEDLASEVEALRAEKERLREELARREDRVRTLEAENESLRSRLDDLEEQVAAIAGDSGQQAPADD